MIKLICSKCKAEKDCCEFNKDNRKDRKRGYQAYCKVCEKERKIIHDKEYYIRTIDKQKERNLKYRTEKKDELEVKRYNNRSRDNEKKKVYYNSNKDKYVAKYNKRRAYKGKAAIGYNVYKKEIIEIYKNRPDGYHVDHIIPLQGKEVCGLHVPWNLQYLLAEENRKKSNKII